MADEVNAFPAKRFFVEMLTRDIDLEAAILDLLDNCVDGCLRAGRTNLATDEKPYAGYSANIEINKDYFSIKDNCGGIREDIAKNYAFRFGRQDSTIDANLRTVGVYGIGMKRAIFKLGTECTITSHHKDSSFLVRINKDWMNNDEKWQLDMEDIQPTQPYGTNILVNHLHDSISLIFDETKSSFLANFKNKLQRHYSLIIGKGFKVFVNGLEIKSKSLELMLDPIAFENERGISPYIYKTLYNGVTVNLIFGLYEKLPSNNEATAFEKGTRTKEDAGWTVICNDRVVVDNDKTHITGWGESPVPHYHSQFIALRGFVSFSSDDASKLPVTTTKRGIDLDSPLYSTIKEEMKQATKTFTNFTNSWKGQSQERTEITAKSKLVELKDLIKTVPDDKWSPVRRVTGGHRYTPQLPQTPKVRSEARIQFKRNIEDIAVVREFICDDQSSSPSDVGIAAFEYVLAQASE